MEWSLHKWHLLLLTALHFLVFVLKLNVIALFTFLDRVTFYDYTFFVWLFIYVIFLIRYVHFIVLWGFSVCWWYPWLFLWWFSYTWIWLSWLRFCFWWHYVIYSVRVFIWVTYTYIKIVYIHSWFLTLWWEVTILINKYTNSNTKSTITTSLWFSITSWWWCINNILIHNSEVLIN
jgi:hypothetical protein